MEWVKGDNGLAFRKQIKEIELCKPLKLSIYCIFVFIIKGTFC